MKLMHGDADAETFERMFFENTDANVAKVEMFQTAYPHLEYYCARFNDKSTEFIVEKIAAKTNLPYDALFDMLEPLIKMDATCSDYMACPRGYTLCMVTPEGVSLHAVI